MSYDNLVLLAVFVAGIVAGTIAKYFQSRGGIQGLMTRWEQNHHCKVCGEYTPRSMMTREICLFCEEEAPDHYNH